MDPHWDESLDFSTCFEDTIVVAIPTMFLLVIGSLRLWTLLQRPSLPAPPSTLHTLRLLVSFLLFICMLGEMCVALYDQNLDFRIVSPAIQALGYVSYQHAPNSQCKQTKRREKKETRGKSLYSSL